MRQIIKSVDKATILPSTNFNPKKIKIICNNNYQKYNKIIKSLKIR